MGMVSTPQIPPNYPDLSAQKRRSDPDEVDFFLIFTERKSLLYQDWSLSWPFPVWRSSWACCSRPTKTPGQALVPSLPDQCWETVPNLKEYNGLGFFFLISQKGSHFLVKLGTCIGHFHRIILFPTCHTLWPAFGSILTWSMLRKQFQISGRIITWFLFFYTISQKDSHFLAKLGAFLGHFQFGIILDMLFPTYQDPWPTFESILV